MKPDGVRVGAAGIRGNTFAGRLARRPGSSKAGWRSRLGTPRDVEKGGRGGACPLWSSPARKFVFSFRSSAGGRAAAVTIVLWQAGLTAAIPGVWLMLYGTGVITGGAFSVPVVPVMGACFLVYRRAGDVYAAGGVGRFLARARAFGRLHILFGFIIAVRRLRRASIYMAKSAIFAAQNGK